MDKSRIQRWGKCPGWTPIPLQESLKRRRERSYIDRRVDMTLGDRGNEARSQTRDAWHHQKLNVARSTQGCKKGRALLMPGLPASVPML